MHVLHLCDGSVEGDYFRNIASGLTKNGVRLTLAQLVPGSAPSWLNEFPDVDYRSFGAATKLSYPIVARRIARLAAENSVDILHTHLFYSGLLAVGASRLFKMPPVALMRHHTSVVRMLGGPFHVRADRWMAENADHVVTVSKAAKDYMRRVDRIGREIDMVYLGFDFDKFRPDGEQRRAIRHEFGFADDDIVIGYVANLVPGKGHQQLVRAFETVAANAPNVKLFFVGGGEIQDVSAARATLRNKLILAGRRSDVPACLNAMDIFVQPSLSEAFSQVIPEAMGVGLPLIATDVGGANEVIDDGRTGLLVDPDDPVALAEQIEKLIFDHDLRSAIGEAGRDHVRAHFTAQIMVERHLDLYDRWTQRT